MSLPPSLPRTTLVPPRLSVALPTASSNSRTTPLRLNVAPPTAVKCIISRNENSWRFIVPYCEPGQNDPPGI